MSVFLIKTHLNIWSLASKMIRVDIIIGQWCDDLAISISEKLDKTAPTFGRLYALSNYYIIKRVEEAMAQWQFNIN